MAASVNYHQTIGKRTRRRHHKSKNGCLECKRRRVKCDEAKPFCERCIWLQNKCVYPPAPPMMIASPKDGKFQQSLSITVLPPSPDPSSCSEPSSCFAASVCSSLESWDNCSDSIVDIAEPISDMTLYHHYLQHTSRTLTPVERDQSTLQIEVPELALENTTVIYAMLAVSAACMCCDMIEKEPETSMSAVNQLLMVGYQHYNLASKLMRESISRPDTLNPDSLLAGAVLLVPFATASQRINHWISRKSKRKCSTKFLSTTPRDAMILMRGIQTTLQALYCGNPGSNLELATEPALPAFSPSEESDITSFTLPPSKPHAMFAIVAATSPGAFSKLRKRLGTASSNHGKGCVNGLSACKAAFETLDCLRTRAFCPAEKTLESKPELRLQMPPWLRCIASRTANPRAHETLTSFFLSFLVQAPQEYFDLLLPLLDQRRESPNGVSSKVSADIGLTTVQALALDICAHWSVLMFLVEEDSWWIGDLPEVTLTGMVNTFGDNFTTRLLPESGSESGKWWPGGMLNILRETKRFR